MTLSSNQRTALLFLGAILLVMVTRWPLMPAHLYSFDSVNLALALDDFDPTKNQPQPPGYPLFVLEAKLFHLLLGTPERTFAFLSILICGLSLGVVYLLGKQMFSAWVGLTAAALLFVNPPFWFSGLTSPLRPHLALFSLLVAYYCWQATRGKPKQFYEASVALGLAGGFRPELCIVLLPLWAWTAWQVRQERVIFRGLLLLVGTTLMWVGGLVIASGGLTRTFEFFYQYVTTQTEQTSALVGGAAATWRRMAGRAIVWTGLGALPWIWSLPFGWFRRREAGDWQHHILFLSVWFFPPFLFNAVVHVADPDQTLAAIPAVCLLGGFCLVAAEQALRRKIVWLCHYPFAIVLALFVSILLLSPHTVAKEKGFAIWIALLVGLGFLLPLSESKEVRPLVCIALLGNTLLFFGQFPFPQGPRDAGFRGLASVGDAFLGGRYESSYDRVHWVGLIARLSFEDISYLKARTDRPVVLVWTRDAEPVWRKVCFYFPQEKVYVLEESGDPAVLASQARLWVSNKILASDSGPAPISIGLPKRARLIWLISGGVEQELAHVVTLKKSRVHFYTDLPPEAVPFRWGSFEFVPQ